MPNVSQISDHDRPSLRRARTGYVSGESLSVYVCQPQHEIVGYRRVKRHMKIPCFLRSKHECNSVLASQVALAKATMRPEEVFNIRRENVHLKLGYLFVPSGKTVFARRNVPLSPTVIDLPKRRLAKMNGPYVFPRRGDSDKPLTTVRKAHYRALQELGVKSPFRLYDYRHSFGSRSAMAGVDLPTLKEL